uniref:DUF3700 domain-containing protein n=1 Tax=Pyramimonas obovata TaxID=1411642 RepID=A0A7S0MRP2_9CHLO|mmetsp:Transcript_11032/g.22994  ORF Transcript_11032/g.22994 Transcript_11032/m.22994 type:complete len:405 (+) Transcript_11032:96-1310(+)|eukprot:CAMPEP_0118926930 /NCGR_PEP_ID=MMETSP1169-20130426/4527_1 /TAXON_ID=36882 /ORGANISM="Pyramimonas obovata, Strain CCMP722" /LENGTH=404 /DNA_ID=CAMNT_0006868591 /DNA_START=78 /DNA_END=1292 /DNA_ORIENTATION=-
MAEDYDPEHSFHCVVTRKVSRPPLVMLSPYRDFEANVDDRLTQGLTDRGEDSMDLEAVKNIVKGLVTYSGECEAEKKYKTLFRGGMGLAVRPKVSMSHQKGARSWGKTLMKFKKKNLFAKAAQREHQSMMEEKKLEAENKVMSENDVICIVNGEIRNQKDLELWHGVSSYDSVSDFVLALYMKGFAVANAPNADRTTARFLFSCKGDFSIIVHDVKREYLLIAQSRSGTLPLYWGTAFTDGSLMISTQEDAIEELASAGPCRGKFPRGSFYESHQIWEKAPEWTNDVHLNRRGSVTSFMRRISEMMYLKPVDGEGHVAPNTLANGLHLSCRTAEDEDVTDLTAVSSPMANSIVFGRGGAETIVETQGPDEKKASGLEKSSLSNSTTAVEASETAPAAVAATTVM